MLLLSGENLETFIGCLAGGCDPRPLCRRSCWHRTEAGWEKPAGKLPRFFVCGRDTAKVPGKRSA